MEIKYKISSKILLFTLLGIIMTSTSYLVFAYNPLQLLIKKFASLTPGSIFFNIWSEPPYEVFIDVYIFNVTNKDEFLNGEKMHVEEIGPYVYQEMLSNKNATWNENGTMTFYPRRALKFRRELSVGDPDTDRIVSPNIPLLGISASLRDSTWKSFAVASFAKFLDAKSFLNITVTEYLWGYDDPLVTYANKFMPGWIDFNSFGILDRLMALDNASNIVTLNTNPSLTPASTLLHPAEREAAYHIHRWNGSPGLKQWGYIDTENNATAEDMPEANSRCNLVEGSFEGTVFPPDVKENSTFKVYRRAFCRPVPFSYKEKVVSKDGFDGVLFQIDQNFLARPEENPDNACFCMDGNCPRKGIGNLAPCYYDIPIDISQPHFLNSDPWLLEQIGGLRPNASRHDSNFVLHPQLGVPLEAKLRMQINLDVGETRWSDQTRPFNHLQLPLFWLQLRLDEIPPALGWLLYLLYHFLPIAQIVAIYLLGLGGLALISGSAFFALIFAGEERHHHNGRLSFRSSYTPIPIIPLTSPYYKKDDRLLK